MKDISYMYPYAKQAFDVKQDCSFKILETLGYTIKEVANPTINEFNFYGQLIGKKSNTTFRYFFNKEGKEIAYECLDVLQIHKKPREWSEEIKRQYHFFG